MKRIKFLLALLMVMLGTAVQAQQVVINKSDGSVEVFQPNEVDSVVYKPAPKYYYYAGWECPRNEEELARLVANADGVKSFGVTKTSNTGFSATNYFAKMTQDIDDSDYIISHGYTERNEYLVVPNNLGVYDADDVTVSVLVVFDEDKTVNIPNHKVYKSKETLGAGSKFIVY